MPSYTIASVLLAIVGVVVGAFVFREIVIPFCVYCVQYARFGKARAEDDALSVMGENKLSYGLKDQLKKNRLIDDPALNQIQDAVGEKVGGLLDQRGLGGTVTGMADQQQGLGGAVNRVGGEQGAGGAAKDMGEGVGKGAEGTVKGLGDGVGKGVGGVTQGVGEGLGKGLGGLTGGAGKSD
ncbi:MAG: hypothetical protein M1831_001273 [Alyxoria varia]|nr:MAG: hypothetical protein M1831_001273 [Alyxoria varia]